MESSLTNILDLALRQGSRGAGWQLNGMSGSEMEPGCDYSGLREKKKAHNLQGDIVGSVDASGRGMIEYKYGAWGEINGRGGSLVCRGDILCRTYKISI